MNTGCLKILCPYIITASSKILHIQIANRKTHSSYGLRIILFSENYHHPWVPLVFYIIQFHERKGNYNLLSMILQIDIPFPLLMTRLLSHVLNTVISSFSENDFIFENISSSPLIIADKDLLSD